MRARDNPFAADRIERPSPSGFQPGSATVPGLTGAAGRPAAGNARRSFGPNALPRGHGKPRRYSSERAPKGPLRARSGGRVFDIDGDSRDGAVDVDDATATLSGDLEPNDSNE